MLKKSNYSTQLFNICRSFNMHIHITEPTRKLSCIDLIISNIKSGVGSCYKLGLSDHDMGQLLRFRMTLKRRPKFWFEQKRDYSADNLRKFLDCMNSHSFDEIYSEHDTDKAFELFQYIFS